MLYFAIEMDEDKLKEKGYKVDDVYECIDAAYAQLQGRLDFIKGNVRCYTRNLGDGDDFQNLWLISISLKKEDWFFKNVKRWEFIKVNEDGEAYYAEDLIKKVRII